MYFLDLLGTLAFAISGATKAKGKELNIFGVIFLGIITAIGGGTVRDLVIGRTPLFYLKDPSYLLIAILGSVLTYFIPTFFKRRFTLFRFFDSMGLAVFAIIGTSIVFNYLFSEPTIMSFFASIFLGALTAVGGGILRDAIIGDTPYAFMHGSNYIASAFAGALVFYIVSFLNITVAIILSIALTLFMREIISDFGAYKKIRKT